MAEPLILGFGRADRGDDGVGPALVARLRGSGIAAEVRHLRPDPSELARAFAGRDAVILVDACRDGVVSGTIRQFDLTEGRPETMPRRTHGMALLDALDLVRWSHGVPGSCTLYAIAGAQFDHGAGLSPSVACAVRALARALTAECGSRTDIIP